MKLDIFGSHKTHWSGHGEYEPGVDPLLEACPFCGGNEIDLTNTHTPYYQAQCTSCDAAGPQCGPPRGVPRRASRAVVEGLHRKFFTEAIQAWNKRVELHDETKDGRSG